MWNTSLTSLSRLLSKTIAIVLEELVERVKQEFLTRCSRFRTRYSCLPKIYKAHSGSLINILKQAGQVVPDELFKFGTTVKKKLDPNYGAFVKDVDMNLKGKKITFDSDDE